MKRIALIMALVLLLTPVLVSCGNKAGTEVSTTPKNTASEETTYEYSLDELPELDYTYNDGKFGIFGVRGSMGYLIAEEETGDLVNDAIFQRNLAIEDKYGLEFNMFETEPNVGTDQIKNFVLSGDTTYQLYQALQHNGMPGMILNNYFVDWTQMDAINFDRPYWNTKGVKNINFGGKIYTIGGDLNLITYNSTNCILFNKKLFDDLGIDYPYQDVYDMEWTVDKFIEIVKQGYDDLNGDTVWDTEGDRLGFSGWVYEMNYAMYIGLGGKTLVNDENDMPVLSINNERTIKVIDKMIEVFDGKNAWSNSKDYSIHNTMFSEQRLLMKDSFISHLASNRESEFGIGLLPYPMLDTDQGEYFSRAANIAHLSYIPTTNRGLDQTGIVLEAMSLESYNKVRPVYYDVTLDLKSVDDEETPDMVDIVLGSSSYLYEGFITSQQLQSYLDKHFNTFSSWYASNEKGFEKSLKKITAFYSAAE